jgi:hypothetical protein
LMVMSTSPSHHLVAESELRGLFVLAGTGCLV